MSIDDSPGEGQKGAGSAEHEPGRPKVALDDAERELSVLDAVLKSLARWDSFARGGERLLGGLANALGQMAGALWLPEGPMLVLGALWCMPGVDRGAVERELASMRVPRGVGLAGSAWERLGPVDSPGTANHRASVGAAHDLVATVAVPCPEGEEVIGVVELYSTARAELSSHLMDVLAHAGDDLGAFLARRRRELTPSPLSPRETEVLGLGGDGLSIQEIGERLSISPATVKTHLGHIYRKLGVRDRTAAVADALRAGFIT